MDNYGVCDYIIKLNDECKYIADQCVNDGYGQTCGGYLSSKVIDAKSIKQKEHFLNYYGKRKYPTYNYLRCPQLLLFVAEVSGLSYKKLNTAYDLLKKYEISNGLYNTDKSGNYLLDMRRKNKLNNIEDDFFQNFKQELEISLLVKTIKNANSFEEVRSIIGKIY